MPSDRNTTARAAAPDAAEVADLVDAVGAVAGSRGREDLVGRLAEVRSRLDRSETVICVVGEFKQGKSALINGLLGADVCPVDDDLATMAVTTVRHGERPTATVHRREAGTAVIETIDPGDLAGWVTERGNPDNRLNVDGVEVGFPHPLLERGVTLVDTPGIGGLNAAHAAATLAFLPVADALVFVTDASAELTRPELEFLASAVDAGPLIVVALTKIDMYPEWRRILAIDERRLSEIDLGVRPFALSAALRTSARDLADAALEQQSGFPALTETILRDVTLRARAGAVEGAFREIRSALEQLREPLVIERQAVERPEAAARLETDLGEVRDRLAALGQAGAHWSVRLDDEFAALKARVAFTFAGRMRQILRDAQDEIERVDPGRAWNEVSARVQQQVADAVRAAFLETTEGAAGIQAGISQLLADEEGTWTDDGEPISFDASSLWQDGQAFGGTVRSGVVAGFGLLAGAAVGVEMLGMLGALLGTALVGPALLGAALFFGGKEVAGERRRQLTDRRQQARTFVGQFAEDVRFEVDGRLATLSGQLQRDMRIRFGERIAELARTYREAAAAIERTMARSASERDERLRELSRQLGPLEELAARTDALAASATEAA
ncbi:MAG: dynamin family protein [Chloroflexota bacterium]